MEELGGSLAAVGCRRRDVVLFYVFQLEFCVYHADVFCRVVTVRTQNCHPNHV